MKRHLSFSIFIFLVAICQAQESPERFKVKTGVSLHKSSLWVETLAHVAGRLSINYVATKNVEVGVYGAYSTYKSSYYLTWDSPLVTYGMELNYHFFSQIQKTRAHSWDLYISGKLGGYYAFYPETMPGVIQKNRLDYGAYFGLGYSFSNYLTPYFEIGYGELCLMELGLSFTF